jgi:magnesium-transporting ATPase (P-type)
VADDVVLISAGVQVAADGRIVMASALQIDESALTGESVPAANEQSRLTNELNALSRWIALAAGLTMVVMFGLGRYRDVAWDALFVSAVSLAIAAIPEALATVTQVILSPSRWCCAWPAPRRILSPTMPPWSTGRSSATRLRARPSSSATTRASMSTRLARQLPRLATLPFDPTYRLMATFHDATDDDGQPVVCCFVNGAAPAVRRCLCGWLRRARHLVSCLSR